MNQPITETFGEDYFMRGREKGLSNYENYTWKRDATVFCAARMALFMGCQQGDSILDWGCSRGYYVRALRMLGYDARGYDISEWAIKNCDPEVRGLVENTLPEDRPHWIFAKDVLEHMEGENLRGAIFTFLRMAKKGALIIVPLGDSSFGKFFTPQDNDDATHRSCFDLPEWLTLIQDVIDRDNAPWTVQGGYKLPGVKEACDPYPNSVAFITMRKLL